MDSAIHLSNNWAQSANIGLCKWETIFLWQGRGYLWTLPALQSGVVFRAVDYSFGHFPYSQLMPILGNRTWKVPSPPPPSPSRNIHLQDRNLVSWGWWQKRTQELLFGQLLPWDLWFTYDFCSGYDLLLETLMGKCSVLYNRLLTGDSSYRVQTSGGSSLAHHSFWLACEQGYLCEFMENFGGTTRKPARRMGRGKVPSHCRLHR